MRLSVIGRIADNVTLGYFSENKLVFDFTTDAGILEYLNHKEFEVDDVWFKNEFYNKGL